MKYYRSYSLFLVITLLMSCGEGVKLYKREFTESEKQKIALHLMKGLSRYYQGSPKEILMKKEMIKLQPNDASIYREIGAPMVKRGLTQDFAKYYGKAVELKPEDWQGNRAYLYLYFYRDYAAALSDIEEYDAFTPDFVDYPQSTSVDYMRGICYYHLGKKQLAYDNLKKHITREQSDVGAQYVMTQDYIHYAVATIGLERYDEALAILNTAQQYSPLTAEIFYYQAVVYRAKGQKNKAQDALLKAKEAVKKGNFIQRNYVEEFFRVYMEDIEAMEQELNG